MLVAIVLFAIAALGGLTLAVLRLRNPELPLALALAHGTFAAAGLVALAMAVVGAGASAPSLAKYALAFFLLAALGGFFLVSFQLRKKPIPIPVMVIHALVAVTAFAILVVGFASTS